MVLKNGETEIDLDVSEADVKGERAKAIITIVLTAVFNIANLYGYAIDAGAAIEAVLTFISFVLIIWSWWKNQNVTVEAATSQKFLKYLKASGKENANGEHAA